MSTPWEPGHPLGARYNVLRELGEGGFGRTYLAEDLHRYQESCVLKEFVPQIEDPNLLAKAQELSEREAKVLYQLEHPQIPKFRELVREGGQLFLVQDYVEGATYRSLLKGRQDYGGHFSETEITQLLYQLLPVLEYIHELGIIHRDISPENLILRNQNGLPVLIDFGSVKQIAATVEQELSAESNQTRIGKFGYVPPEQFSSGSVDATSDLYGLAATLVVLATGREPQDLYDQYEGSWSWERFVTLGEPLNRVLKKMLARSPAQRYPSAAAVIQAMQGDGSRQSSGGLANGLPAGDAAIPIPMDGGANGSVSGSPPIIDNAEVYPTEATQVAAPEPTIATAVSPPKQNDNRTGMLQAAIGLLALLGVASLALVLLFGLGLRPRLGERPTETDGVEEEAPIALSPDEVARKNEIEQRREALGVNEGWLNRWVNQRFYQQYPDLSGRPLTPAVEDAPLRLRWDNLAMDALDMLDLHLSMPARRGLGAYGPDDRESWRNSVNRLNVSSRALEDLADAKFAAIFPEEPLDNILDQPVGQVWYALAQDRLEDLTSGERLEQVEFEPGTFRQRLTGQLAAGEGKVFVLSLQEGQNLRLNLQAPEASTLMSLYLPVPSQEAPFLLSDSPDTTWSGRLNQAGFYEVAIASTSANPLNYALIVAVDNIRTTPDESETDSPADGDATNPPDDAPSSDTPDPNAPEDNTPGENSPETPDEDLPNLDSEAPRVDF